MTRNVLRRIAKLEALAEQVVGSAEAADFTYLPRAIEILADTLEGLNPRRTRADLVAELSKPRKLLPGSGRLSPEAEAIVAETLRGLRPVASA